jgi:CHAT domain-containing protein/tetratricopeptide (TPR) repeat protein
VINYSRYYDPPDRTPLSGDSLETASHSGKRNSKRMNWNHFALILIVLRLVEPVCVSLPRAQLKGRTARTRNSDSASKAFAEANRLRAEWKKAALLAAIAKYQNALTYWQASGDERTALALRGIGEAHKMLGHNQKAISFFSLALRVAETRSDHELQIGVLNSIAYAYADMRDSERITHYSDRALALSRSFAFRRGEAQALNNLGLASYASGDMQNALEHYEQAFTLFQKERDDQGQAEALKNIGDVYTNWGDLRTSLRFYNRALALWPAAGDRRGEWLTKTSMAVVYMLTGELQKALDLDKSARQFFSDLGDSISEAVAVNGIAYIYDELGRERESLAVYAQALQIYRESGHTVYETFILGQMGELQAALGETAKALANFHRKLQISRAVKDRRMEAYTLKDLGNLFYASGDLAKALEYYKDSLALGKGVNDKRGVIYALNSIGRVYYKQGDTQKALDCYRSALELIHEAPDRRAETVTLHHIAQVMCDQGRLEDARKILEQLLSLTESLRNSVVGRDMRVPYFASFREHYELYIDVLMQLHKQNPTRGLNALALATSERARARSLIETLAEAHIDIRLGVGAELLRHERRLQQLLNAKAERLARLTSDKHNEQEQSLLRQEITDLTVQYQEVGAEIRAASPSYATLTQPLPLAVDEIQQHVLDADTLLLEYSLGDERSYVWAVSKTSITSFELDGRVVIEQAAKRFYELLTARNRRVAGETASQRDARLLQAAVDCQQAAERLSQLVVGPVATQLRARPLVIVADGTLQYVPFSALPEPNEDGLSARSLPLVTRHQIISLPSASTLAVLRDQVAGQKVATKALAVLADPVFDADDIRVKSALSARSKKLAGFATRDNRANLELLRSMDGVVTSEEAVRLGRLPFSAQEAQAVIKFAPAGARRIATGFAANRATAMDPELGRYGIIHFATHGLLDSQHPELSGIVLSLVDRHGRLQDGYLRLNEIYNLKLSADMVVLSACQTALGKEIRGEGLVGLTRGFMFAGAARVVASLWRVDDRASAELMKYFYRNMFELKMRPAAALREAQFEMMKQERWKSPYYWAGFILQGEWR